MTSEQFGPYEVHERLGVGGMATVSRAKKRGPAGFERSVALKRMLSHLAADKSFVESFVREAKVASLLVHPNIAQVYDFGRISGVYYIAMELVHGFDVRKLLRYANRCNEAIPMPVILSILGELCDALDYAHTFVDEHGEALHIVHRDISPSNMIVAHTGHLKVIDFGIAKANSQTLHTQSGHAKGKLGYMSPEVMLGIAVGPISDIFSMGVVAWELVTASPLFSARNDFETIRKLREEPIKPPSLLNPACPPALDQLIMAALQREPEDRLASARLFRTGIDAVASEDKIHVTARAVSEWMLKFAQPEDVWARAQSPSSAKSSTQPARGRTPSGRMLPLMPPDPPTAVIRPPARALATRLNRAPEDVALATEIWGEDVGTVEQAGPLPDFHKHVATPLPTQMPSLTAIPQSAVPATASKKPLLLLGVLALVAGALGAVLVIQQTAAGSSADAQRRQAGAEPADVGSREPGAAANQSPHATANDGATKPGASAPTGDAVATAEARGAMRTAQGDAVRATTDHEADHARARADHATDDTRARADHASDDTRARADHASDDTRADNREQKRSAKPTKQSADATADGANVAGTNEAAKPQDPALGATPPVPATAAATAPATAAATPPATAASSPDATVKQRPARDLPWPEPAKLEPRPARTPVVAANAVTKLSGQVPVLRAKLAGASGDVLAKLCIDEQGRVSSVKIVKSHPDIAAQLQSALASWRYNPYERDGKATPVCFPLSLRVVVKSG